MKKTFPEYVQDVAQALCIEPVTVGTTATFTINGIKICTVVHQECTTLNYGSGSTNLDYANLPECAAKLQRLIEMARRPATVPSEVTVTLVKYNYEPGGKWDCGVFNFTADTNLGKLIWDEILPGPRHGEDHHELTVTLNGVNLDDIEEFTGELPDIGAPGKPGRQAERFREAIENEVPELLQAWLEADKELLTRYAPLLHRTT